MSLAAALLGLLAIEISLRIVWHNPFRNEWAARVLVLSLHRAHVDRLLDRSRVYGPGQTTRLRTDERSYLLPSFQYPDADFTIAFLGGSTTECAATREEDRFHARVSALLQEKSLKVNTLNAAVSGNTLQDSLNVLLNHVVEDRPDVAVVMHAVNDIGLLEARGGYRQRMAQPVKIIDLLKMAAHPTK